MEMKPHEKSLGRNPLSDAPYRNPGMVLNGQVPGRHPLGDAPYLDLDTVLNEQGSDRRILSDALHRRPGVVKNEQGSSHLTRWMRRVRKLADGHVGSTRVGFDGVHGGFGYGSRNQEGESILKFALAYDLFVTNTLFRKSLSPSNFYPRSAL
jgi:hypothetical protein